MKICGRSRPNRVIDWDHQVDCTFPSSASIHQLIITASGQQWGACKLLRRMMDERHVAAMSHMWRHEDGCDVRRRGIRRHCCSPHALCLATMLHRDVESGRQPAEALLVRRARRHARLGLAIGGAALLLVLLSWLAHSTRWP